MADLPAIAIVTPCYNQARFLERTILSVVEQGYPNLQYVVMDGGSTDGSVDIIRKHAHLLHDWVSEADAGQYDAIERGFARTDAEVMAWINSDDFYLPWTLRAVGTSFAQIPEMRWQTSFYPGFCDCNERCVSFHRASGFSRESFLDGRHCPNDQRFIGYVPQESTFWRRSLWTESGGLAARGADLAGDFDLWARFAEHADVHTTTSSLAVFRHQPAQRSLDVEAYTRECRASLGRVNERLGRDAPELSAEEGAGRFAGHFVRTPGQKAAQGVGDRTRYKGLSVAPSSLEDPEATWVVRPYEFS